MSLASSWSLLRLSALYELILAYLSGKARTMGSGFEEDDGFNERTRRVAEFEKRVSSSIWGCLLRRIFSSIFGLIRVY